MARPGFIKRGSNRQSEDTFDDDLDDRDDSKRRYRNLSEKKRRDQFNVLVNELNAMVSSTSSRKMDKSTVLQSTISFLRNYNEIAVKSRVHEIPDDWKPVFLSNVEFSHLILEALDGFILMLSTSGTILYASESITALTGHVTSDLVNSSVYDLVHKSDTTQLYNVLQCPDVRADNNDQQVSLVCHVKHCSGVDDQSPTYEPVQLQGHFRREQEREAAAGCRGDDAVFVCIGKLLVPQLVKDLPFVDSNKNEFTSRHSLEWKFLFLDHRASPIIGYLPFEVLGTSGYDYYHVDDLDKVVACHQALMVKGEGTSCRYRFLMKGQQWIWLQTRFYITYHQWTSKPEFIACSHRVVSLKDVLNPSTSLDFKTNKDEEALSNPWPNKSTPFDLEGLSNSWSNKSEPCKPGASNAWTGEQDTCRQGVSNSTWMSKEWKASKDKEGVSNTWSKIVVPSDTASTDSRQSQLTTRSNASTMHRGIVQQQNHVTEHRCVPAVVMTTAQSLAQDQLQRKHQHLQQLINLQQQELRLVSEQLLMARCNTAAQPTAVGSTTSMSPLPLSATQLYPPSSTSGLIGDQLQIQGGQTEAELYPYQLSEQQAQVLFTSPDTTTHLDL